MKTFKEYINEKVKEYFFNNDYEGIIDLTEYLKNNYKESDYELYIGRGDEAAHGIKISSKLEKDKKLIELIRDVECDEEEPEDCY